MADLQKRQPGIWGRRVSLSLGTLEVLLGLGFLYGGCRYGWLADDSAANVGGTFAVFSGLFGLLIPGACLYGRSPARWLSQLVPGLFVALYLLTMLLAEKPT